MPTLLGIGSEIANYGFPGGHPFGPDRHDAFLKETEQRKLVEKVQVVHPRMATLTELQLFHTAGYLELLIEKSKQGFGYLDDGDTPAYSGIFEAASYVCGTALEMAGKILQNNETNRPQWVNGFLPIGGLHHARRDSASGFCALNDCGVVIEYLFSQGLTKIAYVDIDAHHGDGVFYAFEEDPRLIFADIHQHGIYPGTGSSSETGKGKARTLKLNLPVSGGSSDNVFFDEFAKIEDFLMRYEPQFILLQGGADSIKGDPITTMGFTAGAHRHAAKRLTDIARNTCDGRVLAFGGGGYNRTNLAAGWNNILEELLAAM